MKKFCIIFGIICSLIHFDIVSAQTVREGETAVVYYMPQTQLQLDIEYDEVILHRGIYADYAKLYLGATEIVTEDAILYKFKSIKSSVNTTADYSRAYKVLSESGVETQLLTLSKEGILTAFNYTPTLFKTSNKRSVLQHKEANKKEEINVLPLFEEHIVGQSLEQQAQGAAKLIYRLRENRIYLIGGEVDKMPADGKSMELAINRIDSLEQQLVELFVGRIEVIHRVKTINYTPIKSEVYTLAYFSETRGITNADNGEPIQIHITARRQAKGISNIDSNKKGTNTSQICYNLPGTATYSIIYQNNILDEGDIQVAQFGVAVPLAKELFTGKKMPMILFNKQTGNILSISLK